MAPKSFYAVWAGRVPGIYESWPEAEQQVKGYSRNGYKGFSSKADAEEEMRRHSSDKPAVPIMTFEECLAAQLGGLSIGGSDPSNSGHQSKPFNAGRKSSPVISKSTTTTAAATTTTTAADKSATQTAAPRWSPRLATKPAAKTTPPPTSPPTTTAAGTEQEVDKGTGTGDKKGRWKKRGGGASQQQQQKQVGVSPTVHVMNGVKAGV